MNVGLCIMLSMACPRKVQNKHSATLCPLQVGGKLRLQLMPLDGTTAQAMAAAGHHPFLELTLSTTKSLLGVLRHLGTKWQAAAAAAAGGGVGVSALYVHPPVDCPITLRGVCWGGPDCDSQLKVGGWAWRVRWACCTS